MKSVLTRLAVFGFLALLPILGHSQNLLLNGALGDNEFPVPNGAPDDWTLVESPADTRDPAQSTDFADHTTPGPDGHGLWLKPFEGNFPGFPDVLTVDADLYQDVVGSAGQLYRMTGWARFEGGYAGGVDNLDPSAPNGRGGMPSLTDTVFALEFLDSLNTEIGSVEIELKAAGQTNNNRWKKHSLVGLAPAGTAAVRVRASMIDGEFNADIDVGPGGPGQSAFVDDFSLTAIPEPGTFVMSLFGLALASMLRRRNRK